MRNPFLVTARDSGLRRPFPSKAAALCFCREQHEQYPRHWMYVQRRHDRRIVAQFLPGGKQLLTQKAKAKGTERSGSASSIDDRVGTFGYSTREARKVRRALFSIIKSALARGHAVETPIGTFDTVRSRRRRTVWRPRGWQPHPDKRRLFVINQRRMRVRFRPGRGLLPQPPRPNSAPLPPPPPPPRRMAIVAVPGWASRLSVPSRTSAFRRR